MEFAKPRIVISACLGFERVRYDGNIIYDDIVEKIKRYVDAIPVCPEVGIGLGVPREPLRLVSREGSVELVGLRSGARYRERMDSFSLTFLRGLEEVDGFLLKAGSPSCGLGDAKIYGPGGRVAAKGDGIFASWVKRLFPHAAVESEKRLLDYEVRRNFLTRIFSSADLRESFKTMQDADELVEFHRRYKYLLMLFSQSHLKVLGNIVANRRAAPLEEVKENYRRPFLEALSKTPSRRSYVNVFLHIYSHAKGELQPEERSYVLHLIRQFDAGAISLKSLLVYFRGFIYRYNNRYLGEQRLLSPFPEELDYEG